MPLGTSPSGSPVYPPLSRLSARFARSAVQLDLLVGGGWKHLDLAVPCLLSIGNPRYGADRSVRWLLVGSVGTFHRVHTALQSVLQHICAPSTMINQTRFYVMILSVLQVQIDGKRSPD